LSTYPQSPNWQDRTRPHLVPRREKPGKRWNIRRAALWIGLTLLILLIVLIVALLTLPKVTSFRQWAIRNAEASLSSSLGSQVQVRDFALSLSHLTLDLYGVTVNGTAPYTAPPLLTVDHVGLGLGITSILHRQWYVNDVAVNHPVAHVFVDPHGKDNLPKPKSSGSQSRTDLFQLGVRHARLEGGEVYYNNRKSVLDADLHDLAFQAKFDPAQARYSGAMSYRNGHLKLENFRPMLHDLNAEFDATRDAFTLGRATLQSGPSHFQLAARVEDYANPRVHATYSAVVASGEFRRITNNPTLPVGTVATAGTLDYQSRPNVPMLDSMTLNGNLGSRKLQVQTSAFQGAISDVSADYSLANGNVAVRRIQAHLLGGSLNGDLTIRDLSGASQSHLRAAVRNISLAQLRPLLKSSSVQQVELSGAVNADAEATWGKTLDNLAARSNATIQGRVSPRAGGNAQLVPVNGAIHARYLAARKEVSLSQSYIRTPQTSLNLNGTMSQLSALQLRLQSNNLHELETIASIFRAPQPGQAAQGMGLYGTASFAGTVSGSTSAPTLSGQLQAKDLKVKGSEWRALRASVSASPSRASIEDGELRPVDRGRISFHLRTNLRDWTYTSKSPIEVGLNAQQVNVENFTRLAGSQVPVAGTLSANLSLTGSQSNPVGQGSLNLAKARVFAEPVRIVEVKFQGTGEEVRADLSVKMPAGAAQGRLTYLPKQETYQADLQAPGIRLDHLQAVKSRNLQVVGVLNILANGNGSIRNPELTANVESPRLNIRDQTLGNIKLQTRLANHIANVLFSTQAVNTSIRARATVNTTGDYQTTAAIDTQPIPLQPLVAAYAPSQAANVSGQTELHATLRGPLKNKSALDAHATIPVLQVSYANKIHLAATDPIKIDFVNGVLALQRTTIRGTDTNVQLQASIPTNSAAPASILALGTVNLQIAQLFDPEITSAGEMRFDINSYGARNNPDVQGQIHIVNASFASGSAPIGLQNGNGDLTLTKDRLNISKFTGTVGGGSVQASGGVVYKPSLRFDLVLAGQGIRLLYPDGVREGVDANLTLVGTTEASTFSGRVRINQLSFTPDFDLSEFLGQFSGETSPPPAPGMSQNMQLNLALESTSGINLVSRELSLRGNANLNVRGTAAEPVILGRVNLTGGDLIFRGNRYLLQQGTLDFANPSRTQPVVNVAVNTTIQQYNIALQFYGPTDHLRTNYTSVPSLPPADIINLLAFGKTSEASAANPTPGNLGAQSLIASQVSSQVTSRVEKIAGISRLSIDPVLGGNSSQQNPGARITVQQRVTGNIFVTFSTDVTQSQNQVIQLQYNVTPRVTFSGTRDQNGGFGFDTRIQKSW
jgi:translocation and assembly module TamB